MLWGPPLSGGTVDRQGACLLLLPPPRGHGSCRWRGPRGGLGMVGLALALDGDGIAVYSNSTDC
ncbi:MAG: hypothetical protein IJK41_06140 [Muribaculaceae bacterium]|nr:hypothetical protein [Muribaculaceae bacterium]